MLKQRWSEVEMLAGSANNTKFSVLWTSILLLLGSLFYFSKDFNFDFANPTGKSILRVLLDEPEKFEEKFPLKAARGNKMYTIKTIHRIQLHVMITELILKDRLQKQIIS